MSYELKRNQGSAFKNKRKTSDGHADMTGEININGTLHWLDVWQNKTRAGEPWLKVQVREKQTRQEAEAAVFDKTKAGKQDAPAGPSKRIDLDDQEVPF